MSYRKPTKRMNAATKIKRLEHLLLELREDFEVARLSRERSTNKKERSFWGGYHEACRQWIDKIEDALKETNE